ncbi:MAG: DNA mismatch repair protein MutS [Alphaproteobacteria bacterium]|nr:DNA mismatch repair protein MutS [Alphaproteobacteria bacterium]
MTPMLQQYQKIKEAHPDSILFFRLGDFYELFFSDAEKAAPILGVTLTRRNQAKGGDIPMCGVPHHASETYIAKLLKEGMSVAICEQVELAEDAKKRGASAIVKRDVVRVMTPGTVVEDAYIESEQPNYLLCLHYEKKSWTAAYVDLSTSDFYVESLHEDGVENILMRLKPQEVLLASRIAQDDELVALIRALQGSVSVQQDIRFSYNSALNDLKNLLQVTEIEGFGSFTPSEIIAAGVVAHYVMLTHKSSMHMLKLSHAERASIMRIDSATMSSLELFQTTRGDKKGSLFSFINHTHTAFGARQLLRDMAAPLQNINNIRKRFEQVAWCVNHGNEIRDQLKSMGDVERALARLSLGRVMPRDMLCAKVFLHYAQCVFSVIKQASPWGEESHDMQKFPHALYDILDQALVDDMPLVIGNGGVIRSGFDARLDDLRNAHVSVDAQKKNLEELYIAKTGINTLRIKHNNMAGLYVEVSKKNAERMPDIFLHKQTLANTVRFSTDELMNVEQDLASAHMQSIVYEEKVFLDLVQQTQQHYKVLRSLIDVCGRIDIALSHSVLVKNESFILPTVLDNYTLNIQGGWHPVVKSLTKNASFVSNDCRLSPGDFMMITGPNMGGKSTFLRQNALIVLLAHMGCPVPAQEAHIGIVDRIFSRVGASDDLTRGRSTFMVEMLETASILNQSTQRSFVILDEIGRGTSTHDGVALAWSITEHVHNHIKARTLFATHYHELSALADQCDRVHNYCARVREWEGGIVFDYSIVPGVVRASYGLHAAQQAGVPKIVVKRAQEVLNTLTKAEISMYALPEMQKEDIREHCDTLSVWLKSLPLDEMSPKEIFDAVYELKKKHQC